MIWQNWKRSVIGDFPLRSIIHWIGCIRTRTSFHNISVNLMSMMMFMALMMTFMASMMMFMALMMM